jgi:hypothetical protein
MKYIKLYEAFIAERIKAPKALEEIIKGNTSRAEGIKMSKDLADHYMTWLRTSPWGKKQGSDLPLDMVIKASFSWGIDRGLDPKLKPELDALRDSIKESLTEGVDYAVMLTGGSIGDKLRPRDAKGYVGMDVDKDEWLLSLDNAKAKAARMNKTVLSPGEKKHYGLKYVVVPVKDGKFIKESVMEGTSDYGGRAGLTKAETLKIAQKFADAAASVDTEKGKWTVNKRTLEEDSFDLDYNGEEYDGGSYNIYKNGNVVNMALRENPVLGKVDDDIKTIAKGFKKMMANK